MPDIQGAMPVSKDRNENAAENPFYVELSDGVTTVNVDAATNALLVKMVAGSGTIIGDVRITDGSDIAQVVTAGEVIPAGAGGLLAAGSDGANARFLALTAQGLVKIDDGGGSVTIDDGGSSITIDGIVTSHQGDPAPLASGWPVKLTDGTLVSSLTDIGGGEGVVRVDLHTQTIDALRVSKDANPNAPTNPLFVQMVDAAIGGEVHNFHQGASIVTGGVSNHDYPVTAGKTLNLSGIIASASGAIKVELKVGPLATLETRAVGFTTVAESTLALRFEPPIPVLSAQNGIVRIARTNRELSPMDAYSTILGREA